MGVGERVEFMVRPGVPMGHVTGVPYLCALGVAEALGARLRWPFAVVSATGEPVAGVRARAGYDDEGVFVACEIAPLGEEGLDAAVLERAARERLGAWAEDVSSGRAAAGPLAPVLGDYFDVLLGMGERVEVLRGGRVIGEGSLAGVDVWGRATVRLDDAREPALAPEQAELRYV